MARCSEEISDRTLSTIYNVRFVEDAYNQVCKLDSFVVAKCEADGDRCLVIHHKRLYHHPPFGMVSRRL